MEQVLLRGTVRAVVYQNVENGYTVLKLDSEEAGLITVTGMVPMVHIGELLKVTGHWKTHVHYGKQFAAECLERLMPKTTDQIYAFLASRTIKGIGPKTALRIVERFGEQSLDVLEHSPEQIAKIPGVTMERAKQMSAAFAGQVAVRRLIEFLSEFGLRSQIAVRLYRVYGEYAVEQVKANPYSLTREEFGASFMEADGLALKLGFEADDPRRVEAGILFELQHNLSNGHVFLPADKLIEATAQMLGILPETIGEGITRLSQQGFLVPDPAIGFIACYLPEYFEAEQYLSERFFKMAASTRYEGTSLKGVVKKIEKRLSIHYAKEQLGAIEAAATHQIMLLTGGPGTGKTTTLAGILELFDILERTTLLTAPTGRAAKRLSEITGRPAATIHRLLEAQIDPDTGNMMFAHHADAPLKADCVIVDETSMVDLLLMDSLVRALPEQCTLILVGDPDQLPSVGAGNVFSDLIRSGVIHTVCLKEIFRQAQESLIVMNAHSVNRGELPVLTCVDKDFFFLPRRSPEKLTQTISELCTQRLPTRMGIAPGDIQVLSPTRKGVAGTQNLNQILQGALNPPSPTKKEKNFGDFCFREGDRVMQIRNNYDIIWTQTSGAHGMGVFNGDIGTVISIDHGTEELCVRFDDREAAYTFDMLGELELAYAMTVHKSQGSEYRAVILSAVQASPYLLTRSILYTAITRARDLLIVVGDEAVIAAMTENDRQTRRYSGLRRRLIMQKT